MSDTKDPFKDSFSSDNISADDAFSQPDPLQNGFDSDFDDDFFKELDKLGTDTAADDELEFLDQLDDNAQSDGHELDFLSQTPPADTSAPLAATADSVTAGITPADDVHTPTNNIQADHLDVPTDTPPITDSATPTDSSDTPAVAPAPAVAPVTPAPAAKSANKKPLFGKKTTNTKAGEQNKLSALIAGALVLLLLLVGAWFLFNNSADDTPVMAEPMPAPAIVPEAPAPTPVPVTDPAPPEVTTQEMPTVDTNMVDVGAIVTAEIPQDPALIKEEIDRLSDKEQRLAEEAKLIDEQLGMMAELTDAKQEQIALLEAQIAQLEAQKRP